MAPSRLMDWLLPITESVFILACVKEKNLHKNNPCLSAADCNYRWHNLPQWFAPIVLLKPNVKNNYIEMYALLMSWSHIPLKQWKIARSSPTVECLWLSAIELNWIKCVSLLCKLWQFSARKVKFISAINWIENWVVFDRLRSITRQLPYPPAHNQWLSRVVLLQTL